MTTDFDRANGERLFAPDAERRVLACILRDPKIVEWAELGSDMFADPVHSAIWRAVASLQSDSIPLDATSVTEAMRTMGSVDKLAGKRLTQLTGSVVTTANVEHYVQILAQKLITRRVFDATERTRAEFGHGSEGDDLANYLLSELRRIDSRDRCDSELVSDAVRDELKSIFADADSERLPGIKTGLGALDRLVGGIPFGVPTIFGARPGVGKSSLALTIADNAARAGHGVHVFTYEDRINGWCQRLLARHSEIELDRIRNRSNLTVEDRQKLIAAQHRLKTRTNMRIEHAHGMKVDRLVRRVRSERRRLETQLVIVDYLQLMPGAPNVRKFERVGENITALAEMCGRDNVALLVLSQLNRESAKEDREPQLQDFRDSGEIEQVGKLMVALHDRDVAEDSLKLIILKNHQGEANAQCTVRFVRRFCAIF